jgi:hypothetical protein
VVGKGLREKDFFENLPRVDRFGLCRLAARANPSERSSPVKVDFIDSLSMAVVSGVALFPFLGFG